MEKVFKKNFGSKKVNDVVGDDPILKAAVNDINKNETKTAKRRIIDPDEKKGDKKKEKNKVYDLDSVSKFIEDVIYDINNVSKDDDVFKESSLFLDNESKYFDIHTEIFRKRFLTFFLMSIYDDLEIIIDTMYMERYDKKPETPKEKGDKKYKLIEKIVCREVYTNIERLERDLFSTSGYKNIYKWLIKLTSMDFCYPLRKDKKSFEDLYITNLEKCIPHMREICKTDIFNKREKYDDYIVFHLLRTAFCFTIESMKYENLFQHKNLQDCTLDCNFDKSMVMLGHGIKKEIESKEYIKVTPIFNAFVDAHPLIATSIPSCNTLLQSNTAIKAVYLIKFLCADKNVDKVIDNILQ